MALSRDAPFEKLVHGTCVALGESAALLRGPPGAGKSDLALRFLSAYGSEAAALIADDQVRLLAREGRLLARAPESITGLIEVRGVGVVRAPHREQAALALVVDLVPPDQVGRMPPEPPPHVEFLEVRVPVARLAPFESSSPIKLKLLLTGSL